MTGSPSRLSDPIVARDSLVIRDCISFLTFRPTSTSEPEKRDGVDLADLDARDADNGAGLEALHVVELGFQVVLLPEEPGLPADRHDDRHGQRYGNHGDDPNLQLVTRPVNVFVGIVVDHVDRQHPRSENA